MRLATAAVLVASLAWTACGSAGLPLAGDIEPGKSVSLRPGERARTRDGALLVGFDGVKVDSRCARGDRCVWAGDAIALVWIRKGSGPREVRELHTATAANQAALFQGLAVRLLRLDPYPVSGRSIAAADYIATLTLIDESTVAPDQ
jgi:hypothetical protein